MVDCTCTCMTFNKLPEDPYSSHLFQPPSAGQVGTTGNSKKPAAAYPAQRSMIVITEAHMHACVLVQAVHHGALYWRGCALQPPIEGIASYAMSRLRD